MAVNKKENPQIFRPQISAKSPTKIVLTNKTKPRSDFCINNFLQGLKNGYN